MSKPDGRIRRFEAYTEDRLCSPRIAGRQLSAQTRTCTRSGLAPESNTEGVVLVTDATSPNKADTLQLWLLKKQICSLLFLHTSNRTFGIGSSKLSKVVELCNSGDDCASTRLSFFYLTLIPGLMVADGPLPSSPQSYS